MPRQLQVFDAPGRDYRGWIPSVAHVDVMPRAALEKALTFDGVRLAAVNGEPELTAGLPYRPADIVGTRIQHGDSLISSGWRLGEM